MRATPLILGWGLYIQKITGNEARVSSTAGMPDREVDTGGDTIGGGSITNGNVEDERGENVRGIGGGGSGRGGNDANSWLLALVLSILYLA